MHGSKILTSLLLAQFVLLVLPEETHHRQERQSGGQPVVTNQNPSQPSAGNNKPGQAPSNPNSGRSSVPGVPDPGRAIDTRGTEFIFGFTSNIGNVRPRALKVLIGAGGPTDTTVMLLIPSFKFSRQLTIEQGKTVTVDIPPAAASKGSGVQNGTIWIRADRPITVHGINMQVKSHDGFLVIPVFGLGLEYFVASYGTAGSQRSQVLMTGTQDHTRLQILPIQRLLFDGRWFNPGDTILLTLNRMQSVQIQSPGDLTGTRISADKPISVMSGSTCSLVPTNINSCDHLVENVPPVATWGKRFSVLPFRNRTTGQVLRVMAARPNTRFTTVGQVFYLARGGLFREFDQPIAFPMSIVGNKPLLVIQYAKGSQLDRSGDPFMTIIPPIEQYVAGGVTFSSFDQSGNDKFRSFASISVTSWDLFNVYLNNEILVSPSYENGPPADWRRLLTFDADYQIPLAPGANTIASPAPKSRFTAIAYGFTAGSSYAFPVVYGLRRLLCTPSNTAAGDAETDCTGPIVSGIVVAGNHGTALGIQPPTHNQPLAPGSRNQPGWGNFNPSKTGTAAEGKGGGDAGVFFPWYTIPPWQADRWEEELEEDEQECYSLGLLVLALIAPAVVVFLIMLIIICALLFRRPGNTKF